MPSAPPMSTHAKGILIASSGVIILSLDALLVRLAGTDPWTVSFWRGLLIGLTMTLVVIVRRDYRWRPDSLKLCFVMLGIMVAYGFNTSLFVFSVSHTDAANTVVILSSAPFFAALFSRWWLKEYLVLRTRIAIAVCLTGVAIVFGGSMGGVNWLGDSLALLLALSTGGMLTALRFAQGLPRTLMVAGAGYIAALFTVGPATPFDLDLAQFSWLLIMGVLQMPAASFLLMMAPKYLPSPEVSLFLLIEAVLAPVWVWWAISETPTNATFWGGSIILATIAVHATLTLREDRASRRQQQPFI